MNGEREEEGWTGLRVSLNQVGRFGPVGTQWFGVLAICAGASTNY
jgi:hypothetical protein